LNLKTIKDVHRTLYRELVEWFGLPPRVAIDCYRDALANANAWRRNPSRGKRLRVLRDERFINNQEYGELVKLIKLRNILVHRYCVIDGRRIYDVVESDFKVLLKVLDRIKGVVGEEFERAL
jgi:uncharacterized protein YutE (UPF0331/DUF86 family)